MSHVHLPRGSAEALYDFCTKQQGSQSLEGCLACPLHAACTQARGLQYTSLRDLMGMLLYWMYWMQRPEKEVEE